MKTKWPIVAALVLAELALGVAIVLAAWQGGSPLRAGGARLMVFQFDPVSAQAEEERRAEVIGPATLRVANEHGSVQVTGAASDEIVVTARKTAWGQDQADAEAQLAGLVVSVVQAGSTVDVRVEFPEEIVVVGRHRSDTVDLVISVPAETSLEARVGNGAIAASGLHGDAELQTEVGSIQVSDVAGALTLDSAFGDVTVEGRAAAVDATAGAGGLRLHRVETEGPVHLEAGFGEIRYEGGRAASLSVGSRTGPVSLLDLVIEADVMVQAGVGDVSLSRVTAGAYEIHSDSGGIQLRGPSGPVTASTGVGSIVVEDGQAVTLQLSTDSGPIRYAGSLGDGPHLLESRIGDIELAMPRQVEVTVDLQTGLGEIVSELPITVQGLEGQNHWQGDVNGGGPKLTARTENGSITLTLLPS
jgi:DUF4097 and DUF4098 domain-containing protein YvlB